MDELKTLSIEIDKLRKYLHNLIDKKKDLADEEILAASEALDNSLNQYYNLINKKN